MRRASRPMARSTSSAVSTRTASPRTTLYWSVPATATGDIPSWQQLDQTELPEARADRASRRSARSSTSSVGRERTERRSRARRAPNLSPKPPFFQLGILGATIPGLSIKGEIGQQLGYINAMGVGMTNFAILVVIGYALSHRRAPCACWSASPAVASRRHARTSSSQARERGRLAGRSVVVTGATGIAAASAQRFVAEGAAVFVISRTDAHCRDAGGWAPGRWRTGGLAVADLADGDQAEAAVSGQRGPSDASMACSRWRGAAVVDTVTVWCTS